MRVDTAVSLSAQAHARTQRSNWSGAFWGFELVLLVYTYVIA
jgi:hypothetical protein